MKGREEEKKKEMRQMRRGGKRSDWKVTGQPLYERPSAMCSDQWGLRRFSFTSGSEMLSWKLQTSFSLVHWFTLKKEKKLDKWCVRAISVFLVDNMPLTDYSSISPGDGGANADYPIEYHIILYIIFWSLHSHWCILVYLPSFDMQQYVVNKLLIWKTEQSAKNWYPNFHIISV